MGIETALPMLQLGGAAMGAYGAASSSAGAQAGYNAQAQVAQNNAQIADWQAGDALKRGADAAEAQGFKANQVKGTQRATFAAHGVDLGVGSAQNILTDTDYFGAIDRARTLDNAAREAWGYRSQASNYRSNAAALSERASREHPFLAGATSLITSAGKVDAKWLTASTPAARSGDQLPDGWTLGRDY